MGSDTEENTFHDRPANQQGKVDVEMLLDFIFPRSLQHPLSTGRLFAFGMYGPLDANGKLRSGHNGQRVVSTWEIDTMCLQFEREDLLQVGVFCRISIVITQFQVEAHFFINVHGFVSSL